MEASVKAVEKILNYSFKDKGLLEEALTHSSCPNSSSSNYQRLEFVGDAALGLALSNYVFLAYSDLEPGLLSKLRAANISTEKLARVAVRHQFYRYLRHNTSAIDDMVKEFVKAVKEEKETVVYGGLVKAPKVLADIVESVAAAVYLDLGFNLQKLWVTFRGLLEPIVTLEDLKTQPVTMLYELCQKHGKQADIKIWREGEKTIARVYIDGKFVFSSSSKEKEIAKINAAVGALEKLSRCKLTMENGMNGMCDESNTNCNVVMEGAKQKLHELCGKKRFQMPKYSIEKDSGPPHHKKFICAVKVATSKGLLKLTGDERSRVKDAENSAAFYMMQCLKEEKSL